MPMPTTDQPNSNERMAPAPTATQRAQTVQTPRFPGSDEHGRNPVPPRQEYPGQYHQGDMIPPPGWAGTTNVDEPYLPPDFDKVLVMRCYPEAESFGALREMAYQHGREVLAMARESTRIMAELAGQPDPHDLSVERAMTQQPGQPNPGQPMPANPPPRPPNQQPNQPGQPQPGQQPDQPPQPQQQPNQPQREARQQHQDDERERRQLEQAERDRRQHERDDKKNDDKDKK